MHEILLKSPVEEIVIPFDASELRIKARAVKKKEVGQMEVYGPKGLKDKTDYILKAYSEDINIRINGLEKANPTGYNVNVREIKSGVIYKDQKVTVKAFPVKHGSWKEAYGYRFETPDLTIVISGDSAATENIVKNYEGCDVLIHEVYCQKNFDELSEDWQKYHSSFFSGSGPDREEIKAQASRPLPSDTFL